MRVTLLAFDFAESVVPLASRIARRASVQLALPDRQVADFRDELDDRVQLAAFSRPRYRQPARQVGMIRQILQQVRGFDPDVIHIQQGHLWFNWALPALRDYPVVLTVHDPRPHPGDRPSQKTPRFVTHKAFRRADEVIVHARYVKNAFLEENAVSGDSVHVIPLAFGNHGPAGPCPESDSFRVLFFGRIWPYKGLEYLIRAEPMIVERVPEARVVIAGQGEGFDRYRRLMAKPERFIVENSYISIERRDRLFEQAGVVVLPYIEATQTGVIPLAYRHARPVVATTVGGLPEVVEDAGSGFLVPPADPGALAAAVVRLSDPLRRLRMGQRARQVFDSHFDLDAIATQTMAVYERALSHGSRRRTS